MRTLHRLLAIFAVSGLLWIGATGTVIQALDLYALHTKAPMEDPVVLSIKEGMFGGGAYAVLTLGDYSAAPLPQDLDYEQMLNNVLQAAHKQEPAEAPRFVELRVAKAMTIGQVRFAQKQNVLAFDAQTGEPIEAVDIKPTQPPPSLRQTLKELHRFWIRKDVPGVWIELICGIALWVLIITGLIMYFRLLNARARLKRSQFFWVAGGWWRSLHRAVSLVSAAILILVAFSGTWLGFESVWHSVVKAPQVRDASAPLSDSDVQQMATATLTAFRQSEPDTQIKVLRVRIYSQMKQGVVITDDHEARQLVFNTETGKQVSLTEPAYPGSGFPFGTQTHEDIKHFHSGEGYGFIARWLDLLGGLSLTFLSISGLVMYFKLWLARRTAGRRGFLWV